MKKTGYIKNIRLDYFITFVRNIGATQGIWMLYLASKGMSLLQLGLLEGIFHLTSILMETPTGVVADLFGRKASRVIGISLSIAAAVLMIFSQSFALFAAAFIVSALSYNFESGAAEALVYDSLLAEGQQGRYLKVAGRGELIFQAAGVIAFIVNGALGNLRYEYVYYLFICLSAVGLFSATRFSEPPRSEETHLRLLPALHRQYVESFKAIRGSGRLAYLLVFSAVVGASVTLSFYYMQSLWQQSGFSVLTIGIFLSAQALAAGIGGLLADRADKRFGDDKILRFVPPVIVLCFFGLAFEPTALAAFCVMNFFEALVFVATRDYINKSIPSCRRATILSFESLAFSLVMIALFPAFGFVSERIGLSSAFIALGSLMAVLAVVNIAVYKRTGRQAGQ